jgi:hypothetical protein
MHMKPDVNRSKTCCFSGYRPEKLPWGYIEEDDRCRRLKEKLYDVVSAVYASGIRIYLRDGAGQRHVFCEAVLHLRRIIRYHARGRHPQRGPGGQVGRSQQEPLFQPCRAVRRRNVCLERYTPDCMMRRNMYMVDKSSVLIAVTTGGSAARCTRSDTPR